MRIVLDTNVFIAAALKSGLAEDIIRMAANTNLITLIVSEEILLEIKSRLQVKFHWPEERVNFFINYILEVSDTIEVKERVNKIARDPDDNKILECALAGEADLIVSSDQDLIKLKSFREIGIIHPKTLSWTFPEYFKKSSKG